MINIKETFKFLLNNELTFEELGILLTVYHKNQDQEIALLAVEYYDKFSYYETGSESIPIKYKSITEGLIKKGLLEDYRTPNEILNQSKKIKLNKIKVSDAFINLYFVDKTNAYKYAKSLYPKIMMISDNRGKVTTNAYAHNVNDKQCEDYFYKELLKGGQKDLFYEFCFITKEYFKYEEQFDLQGNIIDGKPTLNCNCKFDTYLKTFEDFKKIWKSENGVSDDSVSNQNKFI